MGQLWLMCKKTSGRQAMLPDNDTLRGIKASVLASPSGVVLIVNSGHEDNEPGGSGNAGDFLLPSGKRGWDHIAVAWLDKNGELQFGQMVIGDAQVGHGVSLDSVLFGSVSNPGGLDELVSSYGAV